MLHVDSNARVMTDEWPAYSSLPKLGYVHDHVVHGSYEYARGDIHTNTIEGFWSQLKGGIEAVYWHVSKKYLQYYASEYAWRYSHRKSDRHLFWLLLERSVQPRPTPLIPPGNPELEVYESDPDDWVWE